MHRSDRKFYSFFLIKVNICSTVTGASTYMVFRGKSGIVKISSELLQLSKPLIVLSILPMKKKQTVRLTGMLTSKSQLL